MIDLPSVEEEKNLQSTLGNSIASDQSFSIEAIEAENTLIEDSESTCRIDRSDYCQGTLASQNSFKTQNHTMCKYCVSFRLLQYRHPLNIIIV